MARWTAQTPVSACSTRTGTHPPLPLAPLVHGATALGGGALHLCAGSSWESSICGLAACKRLRSTPRTCSAAATAVVPPIGAEPGWNALLAVILGYCIMVGSCFRSMPQIVKVLARIMSSCCPVRVHFNPVPPTLPPSLTPCVQILRNGSVQGLSLTSIVVELSCYSVILAYHWHHAYPFNTCVRVFHGV